ncbi:TIGR03016 family PEP-CTERM system-associated outer membrane protein [Parvularcula flava]|uniref:TIGR03016 family PEP-CTERM system-associated outer membrane protein n=1 Tax=Aquisalinus luteolus TaxID=1566827 RepID=A0A8J3A1X2_9PROT|nr:TIGR03016 family PEP-CTERM system-associated outer membrane protein [Aquisalinus luteolus]NHK26944.1 TIGR03016 family PEP-CTERM system-associated outer membrane protein [Aquisalinus luteolus]GGH93887.1 hypothetical protein GCM10011355_06780 [Aquisalinus luteolus]
MMARLLRLSLLAGVAAGSVVPSAYAQSQDTRERLSERYLEGRQNTTALPETAGTQPGDRASRQAYEARPLSYVLRVSPRVTYSDNVELAPEGFEQQDALASVYMSGGALVDRVRFKGIVNGSIEVGSYLNPPEVGGEALYDRTVFSPNVIAGGTTKLVDNLFYFDLAASAREQALDETTRSSGGTSLAGNQRLANSYAVSASPYLFRRLGSEATIEARYRYVAVSVDDDQSVEGIDDYLNDSQSHELIAEYSSGRLFDRVGFSVRAFANSTEETGSQVLPEVDFSQASISGDLRYAMNRKVSLVGTVGYDDVETNGTSPFDDDDLSGTFWKAGVALTPGRRSEASLELGERYGGTWVDASASWRYSSRLQFRLSANNRLMTTAQAQAERFNVLQEETLSYAEELRQLGNLTSENILERVLEFNEGLSDLTRQQAGLSRSTGVYADMIAQAPRSSLVLRTGYDKSDFGFEEIDTWSISGLLNHRISRRLDAYARANYQDSSGEIGGSLEDCLTALRQNPDNAGMTDAMLQAICQSGEGLALDTRTLILSAGLDYLLFRDLNAFAALSRSQRFADTPANEYVENSVTVGLSYDF